MFLKDIVKFISPPVCMTCEKFIGEDGILCENCFEEIAKELIRPPYCEKCGFHIRYQHKCPRGPFSMNRMYGVFNFRKKLAKLVHIYKYKGFKKISNFFKPFVLNFARNNVQEEFDLITSVPLHPTKKRERGFDQNEPLSFILSETLSIPYNRFCIHRIKFTHPQARFEDDEKRRKNINNAFWVNEDKVKDKRILLFDDVVTTGATMEESARALLNSGAVSVSGFALALTPVN